MSQQPQQIERDDSASIYEADPVLGKYLSHHPSNRLRLMIIGGILYMLPVGIMQLIFWNIENNFASIFLPISFAAIAGAVLWWMLHHWNREVVLYERGFSFRQGSATAYILYANVLQLIQHIERVGFLGFSRTVYHYQLITDIDETLIINNIYSNPDKLTRSLEAYIARDRLPVVRTNIAEGQAVEFARNLRITREGIMLDDTELFWQEFKAQRVKDGQLILQSHDNETWGIIPVSEINNPVLLIALLKHRGQAPAGTNQENFA